MQKRNRILSLLLAAALSLPCLLSAQPVYADEPADEVETNDTAAANDSENTWTDRTEAEVFAKMTCVAENDNLEFWAWDTDNLSESDGELPEDLFALVNKKNGYIWWSSPINANGDSIASPVICNELCSGLVLTAAQISARSTVNARSGDSLKTGYIYDKIKDGVKVTYFFRKQGIKIPVSYTLGADYLQVCIDTNDISEKHGPDDETPVLAQQLAVLNAFGAADMQEEGYFVIPDGSGAVINFNNQKNAAKTYSQLIYGADTTAVSKTKGPVVEGVSLPMFGICKGENAMLAVASEGDGSCWLCADVSGTGQSNSEYNRCYFKFLLRSSDSYYLGSDNLNPLDVYEKTLSHRQLAVRYYPLTAQDSVNADGGSDLDYVDIAARYRKYLTDEMQVAKTAKPDSAGLYVDLYGGCMKQKNVLGFPVFMKTCMTSYAEMQDILQKLQDAGADSMTVSVNRWTDAGIAGKVDFRAKPSGTLGGKGEFRSLCDYMEQNGITFYPTVSNTAYYSGNGYWALTDTAVRVSGNFARIVDYERAYGVPYGDKKTMSLLSPAAFPALYQKLADNYADKGLQAVSIGALSSTLYGDYGKKSGTSRDTTKQHISDSLSLLKSKVGNVLSEDPNAYVLPYTDEITDLPLSSSGFNLFDGDIPLYQIVMHGLIPYSTKAVNGSADAERLVLHAVAAGSNLRFDLLSAETSELKDTDFDIYYYANSAYWIENAAQYYNFSKDILAAVSDAQIISYSEENNVITTQYDNGVTVVTDMNESAVTMNGQTRYLRDYVEEGAVVFP